MPASLLETELARIRGIGGFVLACFIDPSTGMVLDSVQEQAELDIPIVAAGAGDVADTLSMMTGRLALEDEFEDAIVTLSGHFLLIRLVQPAPEVRLLLVVAVERRRASLAIAHREVRDFCTGLTARFGQGSSSDQQAGQPG